MPTPDLSSPPRAALRVLTGEWHGTRRSLGLVLLVNAGGSAGAQEQALAEVLRDHGLATLLMPLQAGAGAPARRGSAALAGRLLRMLACLRHPLAPVPPAIGVLASGDAAGAALRAASLRPAWVQALVARSAPIEQAGTALGRLRTPVLFVVGGLDAERLASHRAALPALRCVSRLEAVPGTNGSFEQPGALQTLAHLAGDWFARELAAGRSW